MIRPTPSIGTKFLPTDTTSLTSTRTLNNRFGALRSGDSPKKRYSFKTARARRLRASLEQEENGDHQRLSVREVVRLFEEANKGAHVLFVKRSQVPGNGVILVRRKESLRVGKGNRLSLPRDNSVLDRALEPPFVVKDSINSGKPIKRSPVVRTEVKEEKDHEVEDDNAIDDAKYISRLEVPIPSRLYLSHSEPSLLEDPPAKGDFPSIPEIDRQAPPRSSLYRLLEKSRSTATLITASIESSSVIETTKSSPATSNLNRLLPSVPDIISSVPPTSSSDDYELFNVYENSYSVIEERPANIELGVENEDDIYDDVVDLKTGSGGGVYEIVYTDGSCTSSSSSSSSSSSRGAVSVDQNNSLYGLRPSSASSGAGSDEWVDLESEVTKDKSNRLFVCSAFKGGTKEDIVENIYSNEPEEESSDGPRRSAKSIDSSSAAIDQHRQSSSFPSDHNDNALIASAGRSDYYDRHPLNSTNGGHYESVDIVDQDSALCDDFSDDEESVNGESDLTAGNRRLNRDDNGSSRNCRDIVNSNGHHLRHSNNVMLENGNVRGVTGKNDNESIYCLIREAGKKTWSKSLHFISKFGGEDKANGVKWLTLNKKNKRRHSVKSMSTFYIKDNDSSKSALSEEESASSVNGSSPESSMHPATRDTSSALTTATVNTIRSSRPLSLPSSAHLQTDLPPPPPLPRARPTSPPPPPPPPNISTITNGKQRGDSPELSLSDRGVGSSPTSSVFYADLPKSDSSEHGSSHGSDINLRFADEPLYQFYEASVFEREKAEFESEEVSYEELDCINTPTPSEGYSSDSNSAVTSGRPSALELVTTQLNRTLWCQVPQVISSNILDGMTQIEKQVQEAKFELMTSEASYYKSLTVLEKHFALSPLLKDNSVLCLADYTTLFSNVYPVRKCSEMVLSALEKCWQRDIMMSGVCQIVSRLATEQFHTYITYCTDQVNIDRTIKRLKNNNSGFVSALKMLESSDVCQSLSLSSFLLLPMQRITRMPLLMDAILTKLPPHHVDYQPCKAALAQLNKIVYECNEAARRRERYEELAAISRSLMFPSSLELLELLSPTRWLVRSGVVTNINLEPKLTITKKLTAKSNKLTLFLFTDFLVLAKKKGDEWYQVVDYCARSLVQMSAIDEENSTTGRHLIILTMLENHDKKTVELVVCCGSESSRERWLAAVSPPKGQTEGEVLYEDWDCPQVTSVHRFEASQPDELPLQLGDTVNVLRKLSDGWYYGERMRDQRAGWFPANYTIEILSPHVRARNLKQRYRLLALSNTYIQQHLAKKN